MQHPSFFPAETGRRQRLRLDSITRLRWLAIAGQSVALLVVALALGFPTPLAEAAVVILAAAALNVGLGLRYAAGHRLSSAASAGIMAFDILQLGALLYLTGGLQNPFSLLFLAPVLISASALEARYTIALGALAAGVATVLAVVHRPLPWFGGELLLFPPLYVAGIWVATLLGLGFISVNAWRLAEEARQMERALATTERVLAREQHLSALDGLAAAAAHQLGTPLATIAVVAREMQRQTAPGSPLHDDVELLTQEAARCREILGKIASLDLDSGGPLARHGLDELIEEVVAPHRNFGIDIAVETTGAGASPQIPRNPGLIYGLGNIVENAVDFAESRVVIRAEWSSETVSVTIADDGPGFSADMLARMGEPYLTTRKADRTALNREGGGLGLGVFIAKTLIERSGARTSWGNVPGTSGAKVAITWPRGAFAAGAAR